MVKIQGSWPLDPTAASQVWWPQHSPAGGASALRATTLDRFCELASPLAVCFKIVWINGSFVVKEILNSSADAQYQMVAQALDNRTMVGLARCPTASTKFFLRPPKLPQQKVCLWCHVFAAGLLLLPVCTAVPLFYDPADEQVPSYRQPTLVLGLLKPYTINHSVPYTVPCIHECMTAQKECMIFIQSSASGEIVEHSNAQ